MEVLEFVSQITQPLITVDANKIWSSKLGAGEGMGLYIYRRLLNITLKSLKLFLTTLVLFVYLRSTFW